MRVNCERCGQYIPEIAELQEQVAQLTDSAKQISQLKKDIQQANECLTIAHMDGLHTGKKIAKGEVSRLENLNEALSENLGDSDVEIERLKEQKDAYEWAIDWFSKKYPVDYALMLIEQDEELKEK